MISPSPEQQAAIDLGPTSVRIRAGAGTGKTTTVAMVVANLVEHHGVDPERILGITFTNKAAAELSDRVRERLAGHLEDGRQIEVHTYHGFAAQILSEFAALAGLSGRIRVITPTFSRQLIGDRFYRTSYSDLDITSPNAIDKIRTLGDRLSDHLRAPADLDPDTDGDAVAAARKEMLATLEAYAADKKRLGVVDYGDLVTLSSRLMKDHPQLANEVRDRYEAVVLDEYQDTNPAQRVLLKEIFSDGFPVIAVGDEDQTIYEWRGASAENFELFLEHFPRRDGKPAYDLGLTTNRRSTQAILDIANEIRQRANPGAADLVAAGAVTGGGVTTHWADDAVQEAEWIASRFEKLHQAGAPWRSMAVLFRKNKDFAVVVDAMRRADIPIEVANLGGLLSVPEVSDLRAWLTIIERPGDSAAVTQILLGSRYRLGLADLAPLSAWARDHEVEDDNEDPVGITLLEAVEEAGRIEMREPAQAALAHFLGTYRAILVESQGSSLVETCRLVLDHTRAWRDMDSLPQNQRLTARLNIYRMLDLAEGWSPLGDRPSLAAFLDYLDAMQDEPAEELDSAHLSGEDAVTLVTVHRAKGLEWDVVAIPAVVEKNFPGKSGQHPDPMRFPEHLLPRYRIDRLLDGLPNDKNGRDEFFRDRNAIQEWRIAYVAATRACRSLIVTGAFWYGLPEPRQTAAEPSELFTIVARHAGSEEIDLINIPPRPELLGVSALEAAPDPLFAGGWSQALRNALNQPHAMEAIADARDIRAEFDEEVVGLTGRLFDLDEVAEVTVTAETRRISVTGLVTYARCPKRFYWTDIDPLPRRRNPAAVAGTELHRRIELFNRGQIPIDEIEVTIYDVPGEGSGTGGFAAFESSRFAAPPPTLVEAPFELAIPSGYQIRGRIDAIYTEGEHWEVVDFKSGKPKVDPAAIVQLEAYSIAASEVDFGRPPPRTLDVTFAHLGDGLSTETHHADNAWVESARQHIDGLTTAISDEVFDESPGAWCANCDFVRFCDPGQRWLTEN